MRRALAGSIAMHGAAGALLIALVVERPPPPPPHERAPIAIELVAPHVPAPTREPAGGAPAPARAAAQQPSTAARVAARTPRAATATTPAAASVRELLAATTITSRDDGTGDDSDGDGGGDGRGGRGGGTGIGLGDGAGIAPIAELPPPPPPPAAAPVSKARPARLIYPSREHGTDDEEVFHARVTVDRDGYVVGARIMRRTGSPREELASQLIWRFRYAPALDDDGRPIQSMVDQPFLVGR